MKTKTFIIAISLFGMLIISFSFVPMLLLASTLNQTTVPIIQSVALSTDTLTDGGLVTLTVQAQSVAPVDWINLRLDGPNGNIFGGGHSTTFTEISPGIWEKQRIDTISEWAPSGVYIYSNLSVENEAQFISAIWPPITFTVNNSNLAQVPVIQSTVLSTDTITDGGKITLTVRTQSNAPVDWINLSLKGPNGIVYGGGHSTTFTEISPGIWEKQEIDEISEWSPSGVYTYYNLSVENEGELESATWPPITFTVENSNSSQPPIIQSATLNTDIITDGGAITLTVQAQSVAPVDWINLRLDGPNGNIFGGGHSTTFTEISPGIWEKQRIDTISEWAPSGVYTYSNLSVENEAQLKSVTWPSFTFTVKNGSQATISPTIGGILVYTNKEGFSTTVNVPSGAVTDTIELRYMPIESAIPPTGYNLVGKHKFMLTAHQNGDLESNFVFLKPVTITIHYSENDTAGVDEDTIVLYWKDVDNWEDVINTCIPPSSYERSVAQNWLKVPVCHLTEFAVYVEAKMVYLPVVLKNQ